MNHLTPGSISWAAFLKMGALLENSPNKNLRPAVMPNPTPFHHVAMKITRRLLSQTHHTHLPLRLPYLH